MLLSSSSKRGAGAPYILLPSSHFPCHLRSKGNCLTSTPDFIKEKKEWGNIIQLQSYIYKWGRAIMLNYRERSKKSGTVINHVAGKCGRIIFLKASDNPTKLLIRGKTLIHGLRLAGSCLFGSLARNDECTLGQCQTCHTDGAQQRSSPSFLLHLFSRYLYKSRDQQRVSNDCRRKKKGKQYQRTSTVRG